MARKPNTRKGSTRRSYLKRTGVIGTLGITGLAGCLGGEGDNGGDGGNGGEGGDGEWEPDQNVRIVVPWGAGGGTDTAVRQVTSPAADIMEERGIDVEVNVENITGAGGLNAANSVLNQPADGHTIFAATSVIAPQIAQGSADFTFDDWAFICRMQHDTSWAFTGAGAYEDVYDFVETAEQEGITWAITGGLSSAAFPVQFSEEAGIIENVSFVAYDDAGQMTSDLLSGEIDAIFDEIVDQMGQIESGDIDPLFVGLREPFPDFEDVPNIEETGWEADWATQRALAVPAGTPQDAIDFWDELVQDVMETEEYQQFEEDNYLHVRDGYLPGPEHKQNLQDQVPLFETVVEYTQ